ncbi:MAG: hypothetical protein DHS20C19_03600 [Acidimicrobiales bacterium]|nr:MAG: hypothetical protein DHS20C19_03600 [Acidimicrobiales bacterium]
MTNFCPQCGTSIPGDPNFCAECGTPLPISEELLLGAADFRAEFPNPPSLGNPPMSSNLRKRAVALGEVGGRTRVEIERFLGPPNSIDSIAPDVYLCQWMQQGTFGGLYHIGLIFDRNDFCGGVNHESAF